jgi:hypothetical protein
VGVEEELPPVPPPVRLAPFGYRPCLLDENADKARKAPTPIGRELSEN